MRPKHELEVSIGFKNGIETGIVFSRKIESKSESKLKKGIETEIEIVAFETRIDLLL